MSRIKNIGTFILLAFLGYIPAPAAADPPATPNSPLPAPIQALLDREYPGWKLASSSKEVLLEFQRHHVKRSPSFLTADFDGDGKPDYAVQIVRTEPGLEEQSVIGFMVHDGAYEETVLESRAVNPSVYLWSTRQSGSDGAGGSRLFMRDRLVIMGGELGESSYDYENGKFREVSSADEVR